MAFIFDNSGEPEIVLDLSRLLSRVTHATPTGVDRCEMAYARSLVATVPASLRFAAVHPVGIYGRLPSDAVHRFLDATEARWETDGFDSKWQRRIFAMKALAALRPQPMARGGGGRRRAYVLASPNNLTNPRLIKRILDRESASLFCLVHDLIPLDYPEYARPDGAARHRIRIETIASIADGILANSRATLDSMRPWVQRAQRSPAMVVAHLGLYDHIDRFEEVSAVTTPNRSYFIAIATIEPRKNHLLLLNLWRRMAETRGAEAVPKLVLVGRRGWENEQVVDMLERSPGLRDCVEEHAGLPDHHVRALLKGARALLLPSFAEGFGMPVTEALAAGTPILCSDLPALREAGADIPEYLDPLDGPAWQRAIDDLTFAHSQIRSEQEARRAAWQRPTWSDHIAILLNMLHRTRP